MNFLGKSILSVISGVIWITNFSGTNEVAAGDRLIGNWISRERDLIVNCYKVNNLYYGKLVWFKKYNDKEHGPKEGGVPESQWINYVVMKNLKYKESKWVDGQIKDLNTGSVYSNEIEMDEQKNIIVTGYIFLPIFGKSLHFTRQ